MQIGNLYLITDPTRCAEDFVQRAIAGGFDTVQFRSKNTSAADFLHAARIHAAACRRRHVPFLVNDRVDLAKALDADGAHLGADDLPLELAREWLGPERILGGSADTPEEVALRAAAGADYCGIGPVFATSSKSDAGPVIGLDGLARAVKSSSIPLIAIGGIDETNLGDVAATGVHGAAILSAAAMAENVEEWAQEARQIWNDRRP